MTQTGQTIADQIGTIAFAMLGARNIVSAGKELHFAIKKTARGINRVVVRLDADGTYTVKFWNVSRSNETYEREFKKILKISMVSADTMRRVIENGTGVYLSA